jgi:hypothetical protein
MDRLARNAMLAKQANMSYGKWKAMQPIVEVKEKPKPDGWRECEHCGKPFQPKQGKRFCTEECRREAYREKDRAFSREYQRERRARMKGAAANG